MPGQGTSCVDKCTFAATMSGEVETVRCEALGQMGHKEQADKRQLVDHLPHPSSTSLASPFNYLLFAFTARLFHAFETTTA